MIRLQRRDQEAFSLLYSNYCNALLGIIRKIVNEDLDLAKDILQEAMVKIWNNVNGYDSSKGTLFTWMLNICRNQAIDHTRSKSYKNQAKNFSFSDQGIQAEEMTNELKADTIGVKKLLHVLSPEQKQVVDVVYMLGYSHSEAAEQLKLPVGTVKTRLRAAIMELRKYVKLN